MLQDYIHAVTDAEARVVRLTRQIEGLVAEWSMAPVVAALQAMRGVAFLVAVTVVAEVGDFSRFANPRQLMAYLGLVPLGAFQWRQRAPWWHHQGRQRFGTADPDRGSLELPDAGPRQPQAVRSH